MDNPIIEFINRRFKEDCHWLTGNCFYFATILKARFPEGKIVYDVTYGHFLFCYEHHYYDYLGENFDVCFPIDWDVFKDYDPIQYERVVEGCIL